MVLRWCLSRSLLHGHRHAWDLHIDREESASGGEVKRSPIIAAKGDVGGGGLSVDDAAQFPALGINDVETACAAAVEVALGVNLHAIWHARVGAASIHEHAAGIPRCR